MDTPITIFILPALRFQPDQINSLRNGRDSDLKQTENAFKDPEDGFWEKNSSGYRYYSGKFWSILEIGGQCGSIATKQDRTLNSDKKNFWNCLKSIDESVKQKVTPEISEENWLRHFQSLHSNDLLNPDQQNVVNELQKQQDSKIQSRPLDYSITELEIRAAVKKLKNNKSPYSDKIRNEMIKASLNEMMPVYHKLLTMFLIGVRCL